MSDAVMESLAGKLPVRIILTMMSHLAGQNRLLPVLDITARLDPLMSGAPSFLSQYRSARNMTAEL